MPISVVCGSCSAKLMAPDAAAGKRVKCRNCQSVIAVPAVAEVESDFEYVDPTAVAPAKPVVAAAVPVKAKSKPVVVVDEDEDEEAPKPKKKSKAAVIDEDEVDEAPRKSKKAIIADVDEDDEAPRKSKKKAIIADDEEEDDEAPRKGKGAKGKKAAKKKISPMIFVLGGVGALFAVGFLGVMVWYFAIRDKGSTAGTSAIPTGGTAGPVEPPVGPVVPAGWTKYEKPEYTVCLKDSFGKPTLQTSAKGPKGSLETTTFSVGDKTTGRVVIIVTEVPRKIFAELIARSKESLEQAVERTAQGTIVASKKEVTMQGSPGIEYKASLPQGGDLHVRVVYANNRLYQFVLIETGISEASETYRVFYDNVKLNPARPDPVDPPLKISDADATALLIGKWTDPNSEATVVNELKRDGTFAIEATFRDGAMTRKHSASGTWKVSNGQLSTTVTASSEPTLVKIGAVSTDRILSIDQKEFKYREDSGNVHVFQRLGARPDPIDPPDSPDAPTSEDPEVAAYFNAKGWKTDTSTTGTGDKRVVSLTVKNPNTNFTDYTLSADDCKMLGKSKSVKALDLSYVSCTDAGAKLLAVNQTLLTLFIKGDELTDAGIRTLTAMKSLTYVNVRGNDHITDAGIGELAQLPNLDTLYLVLMRKLTGSCFEKFVDAKKLRVLYLMPNGLPNSCAQHLAKLTQLRELTILTSGGGDLSSAGIKTIVAAHLPYHFSFDNKLLDDELLISLVSKGWLYGPTLTGEMYPRSANASEISSLSFGRSSITDKGFDAVSNCTNAQAVDLSNTNITDATLLKMSTFKQLTKVELAKCNISGTGLMAISSAPIDHLDLHDCPLDENAFRALGKMPNLKRLSVAGTKSKAAWVQHLAGSRTLQRYIAQNTEFDDDSALQLAKIPSLTLVEVPGEKLTDKGFAELAKLPNLQSLTLEGKETKVSKAAYLKAKKDYPKVRFYCNPLEFK